MTDPGTQGGHGGAQCRKKVRLAGETSGFAQSHLIRILILSRWQPGLACFAQELRTPLLRDSP